MTVFRDRDWAKKAWSKVKALVPGKAQWHNLTGKLKNGESWSSVKALLLNNKKTILLQTGALIAVSAVVITGYSYVKENTVEVYRVEVAGEELGLISSPEVYDTYKADREQQLAIQFPQVHMELPDRESTTEIQFIPETLFKPEFEDSDLLAMLDEKLEPDTIGAELWVDGKLLGYVKDEETAVEILEHVKEEIVEKKPPQVVALSAKSSKASVMSMAAAPEKVTVDKVEIVENINIEVKKIQPQDVLSPEEMLDKLLNGGVSPFIYTVVKGDTISQIAQKYHVSTEHIYERNPWIVDDMIREGDKLDLTQPNPAVSVRTEETVVEEQEIAFDTEYINDDTLRAGTNITLQEGKSGLKRVTYHLVKINGQVISEELTDEQVLEEPVKAVVKKGTLVIKGEGTGKFAWPISSPKITSTFGKRWGKQHKGLDMIGNENIKAADHGVVKEAGNHKDYGNYVILDHKNGYKTVYMHMRKLTVSKGDIVQKGDKIGLMGNTGQSFGKHLHFEIHKDGTPVNPSKYLSK